MVYVDRLRRLPVQAHKTAAAVVLYSRPGNDLSDRFPAIAEAVAAKAPLILDGELVAFGDDGQPGFHLLRRKRAEVVAFFFDILESDVRICARWSRLRTRRWYLKRT